MPDVHWGLGATVGSATPDRTRHHSCCRRSRHRLWHDGLPHGPDRQRPPGFAFREAARAAIESAVPHGRTDNGGRNDKGAWQGKLPAPVSDRWTDLVSGWEAIAEKHPKLNRGSTVGQAGHAGTGNHFIDVCLDEEQRVWFMLHSGSRGVGNRIGTYFISLAKEDMKRWFINLPDADLAYLPEGTEHFGDYVQAVSWAQSFARNNRALMMENGQQPSVARSVARSIPKLSR